MITVQAFQLIVGQVPTVPDSMSGSINPVYAASLDAQKVLLCCLCRPVQHRQAAKKRVLSYAEADTLAVSQVLGSHASCMTAAVAVSALHISQML